MEFCGREPFDVLAIADAGDNARDFTRHSLKKAMAGEEPSVPHCKVPIQQGVNRWGHGMPWAGQRVKMENYWYVIKSSA